MRSVIFDRTGESCITAFDSFICLLNFFYSELKSSGAIVYPTFWRSCQDSYYRILCCIYENIDIACLLSSNLEC